MLKFITGAVDQMLTWVVQYLSKQPLHEFGHGPIMTAWREEINAEVRERMDRWRAEEAAGKPWSLY